jgi:hypothetical protein
VRSSLRTLLIHAVLHGIAQPHRIAEMHQRAAAVDEHAQNLAEAPDQHPIFGEEQAPQARLLVRRASPEDRNRHQVDVELRIGGRRSDQLHEDARRAHGAPAEQAFRNNQFEVRPPGARQIELGTHIAQHGEIGRTLAFEHIAHRPWPCGDRGGRILGLDADAHPQS